MAPAPPRGSGAEIETLI
jgi:hypothetical protein